MGRRAQARIPRTLRVWLRSLANSLPKNQKKKKNSCKGRCGLVCTENRTWGGGGCNGKVAALRQGGTDAGVKSERWALKPSRKEGR